METVSGSRLSDFDGAFFQVELSRLSGDRSMEIRSLSRNS
jgi:hypothetical protein